MALAREGSIFNSECRRRLLRGGYLSSAMNGQVTSEPVSPQRTLTLKTGSLPGAPVITGRLTTSKVFNFTFVFSSFSTFPLVRPNKELLLKWRWLVYNKKISPRCFSQRRYWAAAVVRGLSAEDSATALHINLVDQMLGRFDPASLNTPTSNHVLPRSVVP